MGTDMTAIASTGGKKKEELRSQFKVKSNVDNFGEITWVNMLVDFEW